jgi:hypothetical protein
VVIPRFRYYSRLFQFLSAEEHLNRRRFAAMLGRGAYYSPSSTAFRFGRLLG